MSTEKTFVPLRAIAKKFNQSQTYHEEDAMAEMQEVSDVAMFWWSTQDPSSLDQFGRLQQALSKAELARRSFAAQKSLLWRIAALTAFAGLTGVIVGAALQVALN